MAQTNHYTAVRITEKPEQHFKYKGPFKEAIEVANRYGFRLVEPFEPTTKIEKIIKKETRKKKRERTNKKSEWYVDPADKLAEVHGYFERMSGWGQPVLACHTLHPRRKVGKVRLTVFGSTKSIAEGLVIKTMLDILREEGHENLCVDINSLGTMEARERFLEEYHAFYRDRLNDLDTCCQTDFKNDILRIRECDNETCVELQKQAPQSLTYLTDKSQQHLKQCIEFIESLDVPYRINNDLVGSEHYDSHTVFQIRSFKRDEEGAITDTTVLARGERHEHLPKKLGENRCVPVVSASIDLPGQEYESYTTADPKEVQIPKIFHLHLGIEAKRKSLRMLEMLRKVGVPFVHGLMHDSLSYQMDKAKNMKVPYALIMGLKEVQEDTVILRNMFTRAQETIPLTDAEKRIKEVVK